MIILDHRYNEIISAHDENLEKSPSLQLMTPEYVHNLTASSNCSFSCGVHILL